MIVKAFIVVALFFIIEASSSLIGDIQSGNPKAACNSNDEDTGTTES